MTTPTTLRNYLTSSRNHFLFHANISLSHILLSTRLMTSVFLFSYYLQKRVLANRYKLIHNKRLWKIKTCTSKWLPHSVYMHIEASIKISFSSLFSKDITYITILNLRFWTSLNTKDTSEFLQIHTRTDIKEGCAGTSRTWKGKMWKGR